MTKFLPLSFLTETLRNNFTENEFFDFRAQLIDNLADKSDVYQITVIRELSKHDLIYHDYIFVDTPHKTVWKYILENFYEELSEEYMRNAYEESGSTDTERIDEFLKLKEEEENENEEDEDEEEELQKELQEEIEEMKDEENEDDE